MAGEEKKRTRGSRPEDVETLTPPLSLDGSRPAPQASTPADEDNRALTDDALAGDIKLPGQNSNPNYNPSNPYAGEGYDAGYKPPQGKSVLQGVTDFIVENVGEPLARAWGGEPADSEKKDEAKPSGKLVFPGQAGASGGAGAGGAPFKPYEIPLANPERLAAEQASYRKQVAAVEGERQAVEGQKDAADGVARAEAEQNRAKSKGDDYLAATQRSARSGVEDAAKADKARQDDLLAKMDAFSQDLASDRIGFTPTLPRRVTWTFAKMLGEVQKGFTGAPTNEIANQIDAEIKQEIENQKANHSIKRERLGDMRNFYSLAAEQSKDQAERQKLAQAYALEAAKHEVQSLADVAATPLAQAKANQLNADLAVRQAQLLRPEAEIETAAIQRGIAEHKWVTTPPGGGGKPADTKNVFFDPLTGQHYAAKNEKSRERLTESASAMDEFGSAANAYLNSLQPINGTDKALGKVGWTTGDMGAAKAAYNYALGIVRKKEKDGVWKPSEAEMLVGSLVPPDHFSGDPQRQLDVLNKNMRAAHMSVMRTEAPDPVVAVPQQPGTAPKNVPTGQSYQPPPKVSPSSVGFTPAGAKAKGGDVKHEQPYLVGEEGPELVVPNKPGFVLTALQTAALRGAPPTHQQLETLPAGTKSAVQRFAEKAGVARAGGGALLAAANALGKQKAAEYKAQLEAGPAARRLSDGTPETNYETELTRGGEEAFHRQMGRMAGSPELGEKYAREVPGKWSRQSAADLPGTGEDYDYRGAFAAGETPNGQGHWTDRFKKPNHETFSVERGEQYFRNPQRPPEWLERYMNGEDGAPIGSDYEDDEDAVAAVSPEVQMRKSAIQRYAEKMGVARAEGGYVAPPPPHPLPPPPPPPVDADDATRYPRYSVDIGRAEMEPPPPVEAVRFSAARLPASAGRYGSWSEWADAEPEKYDSWAEANEWPKRRLTPYVEPEPAEREMLSFHRDSPAAQAAVKRAHEDRAGKEADMLRMSFARSLAEGPSVRVDRSVPYWLEDYKRREMDVGPSDFELPADPYDGLADVGPRRDPYAGLPDVPSRGTDYEFDDATGELVPVQGTDREADAVREGYARSIAAGPSVKAARAQGGAMQGCNLASTIARDLHKAKRYR